MRACSLWLMSVREEMKKKRKVRVIQMPTKEQLALTPKQKAALEDLFRWEKASGKSTKIIGVCV
jgi:hypothetical protein